MIELVCLLVELKKSCQQHGQTCGPIVQSHAAKGSGAFLSLLADVAAGIGCAGRFGLRIELQGNTI